MGLVFNHYINTNSKPFTNHYLKQPPQRRQQHRQQRKKGGKLSKQNKEYLKFLENKYNYKVC